MYKLIINVENELSMKLPPRLLLKRFRTKFSLSCHQHSLIVVKVKPNLTEPMGSVRFDFRILKLQLGPT